VSETTLGVLSMPNELFWDESNLHRVQVDAKRHEAVRMIRKLQVENKRLRDYLIKCINSIELVVDTFNIFYTEKEEIEINDFLSELKREIKEAQE
jgi:archaellum biogenesis ATPase FlaH